MTIGNAISIIGVLASLVCALWGYLTFRREYREGHYGEYWSTSQDQWELDELLCRGDLDGWRDPTAWHREQRARKRVGTYSRTGGATGSPRRERSRSRRSKKTSTPKPDTVPNWAFALMAREDAERYHQEWAAHLAQLIEDGEKNRAKVHRRRLLGAAVAMAIILRVRRILPTAHSRPRSER